MADSAQELSNNRGRSNSLIPALNGLPPRRAGSRIDQVGRMGEFVRVRARACAGPGRSSGAGWRRRRQAPADPARRGAAQGEFGAAVPPRPWRQLYIAIENQRESLTFATCLGDVPEAAVRVSAHLLLGGADGVRRQPSECGSLQAPSAGCSPLLLCGIADWHERAMPLSCACFAHPAFGAACARTRLQRSLDVGYDRYGT